MRSCYCPMCKSTHTEEHGAKPGDFNWWLCRDCGFNWPTKENDDEKGL